MAERPTRQVKKNLAVQRILMREQQRNKIKEVRKLLKKSKVDLTTEESSILNEHANIVTEIQQKIEKHRSLSERSKEIIDPPDVLEAKCKELADALRTSSSLIIYTGAGISTAAKIPDYRGPEGVWTLLRKGKKIEVPDLSIAKPTYTHMTIRQLQKMGLVKHVVSQNCDGLHLRSGLPVKSLSEIHGNMFVEVCTNCKPVKQYVRMFDVTENTSLHRHYTGRFCKKCGSKLKDTIVHFGEKGKVAWPLNWKGAAKAAANADVILCLGSSLKVLKRYPCLWASHRPPAKRPKLYIVNLQWTPKDTQCTLKIHAKCDDLMKQLTLMMDLKVTDYCKDEDPIFHMATPLTEDEKDTTTRKDISPMLPSALISVPPAVPDDSFYAKKEVPLDFSEDSPLGMITDQSDDSKLNDFCSTKDDSSEVSSQLLDATDCMGKLAEEDSAVCPAIGLTGWYGKGCAKMRKPPKRKRL